MVISKFFHEFALRSISAIFMLALVIFIWNLGLIYQEILSLTIFIILFIEWAFLFRKVDISGTILFCVGAIYLLLAGIGFWDILHHPRYYSLIPAIMMVVWVVDSGSYLVGSLLKGPKLAPSISSGKTWSGFFGGVFLGHLAGYFVIFSQLIFLNNKNIAFMITFFIPFLGQLGDLLESKIKRTLHVKDSSGLIPGHGGFLDRLDSTLIIFFIWEIYVLIKYFDIPLCID